ncbi:uncharacterized protein LOC119791434 isoform X2 [Cyprinodon tularosa]|uniref:uncharacterized protein LOC119791434 isoform X2 n=1 Tax=Cyprinodon tularosa TaxID=77115 RepID=UPI0018E2636E|nr:uncharacterized protein LOC119791434 isoform X2 [Cyprinodon tularosa]
MKGIQRRKKEKPPETRHLSSREGIIEESQTRRLSRICLLNVFWRWVLEAALQRSCSDVSLSFPWNYSFCLGARVTPWLLRCQLLLHEGTTRQEKFSTAPRVKSLQGGQRSGRGGILGPASDNLDLSNLTHFQHQFTDRRAMSCRRQKDADASDASGPEHSCMYMLCIQQLGR